MKLKNYNLSGLVVVTLFCIGVFATFNSNAARIDTSESHYDDLWDRVRDGFVINTPDIQQVRKLETAYTNHPRLTERIFERSAPYLYYIIEELIQRGMPTEIALLPMIESAFDPTANSNRRAAGLWQFMSATGKSLGIEQNVWHDDRRDVVVSTQAALDYLEYLYDRFDNWPLALAAYNWGETAIRKSIENAAQRDGRAEFHDIRLPQETRNHVHKLLAIKKIIANPSDHGINLRKIPNQPYFDEIQLSSHIDIALVAQLAGVSLAEFNMLNPAYKRPVVKVLNESRVVLLPVQNVDSFVANLAAYDDTLLSWKIYEINQKESINEVARKYGLSMHRLRTINNLEENDQFEIGQRILLPLEIRPIKTNVTIVRNKPDIFKANTNSHAVHIVKKGDTLPDIAKYYGSSIRE